MNQLSKATKLIIGAILAIAIIASGIIIFRPKTLDITFMNVGDGLCTIIKSPSGNIIVFDCGTSKYNDNGKVGSHIAAKYLDKLGANDIDLAVLSHAHDDHMNGFLTLFEKKHPKMVILPQRSNMEPDQYRSFLKEIEKINTDFNVLSLGDTISLGGGAVGTVLNTQNDMYDNLNDCSTVIRISYGHTSVLLTGDAGIDAETNMTNKNMKLDSTVLQVPHHGSNTGTSARFLRRVKPKVAVISCSEYGRFNYPSHHLIQRLKKAGADIFITGRDGAVTIKCTKNSVTAHCQNK